MAQSKKVSRGDGYYGNVTNKSAMYVGASYPQDGGKAPQVRKGTDLRSGSGKK